MVGGDFNLSDIERPDARIVNNHYQKVLNEQFMSLFEDLALSQIVD